MRWIEYHKSKGVVRKRKVCKIALNIRINDEVSVFLLAVCVQDFAEVTLPFFAALVAVYRVRLVLLKPNRPVSASHIKDLLVFP